MSKQQEIREGVKKLCRENAKAVAILHFLSVNGVMIRVGGIREIPRAAADSEAYVADKVGVSWERSAGIFRSFKDAGYAAVEPLEECTPDNPCCERRGEYNGFASGPLKFVCPKHCSCHD